MLSFLENSVDNHIHCCPHINKRSTNIFEVVEHAENNKMYAIGLMDNFSNTSGYASLIRKHFPNLNLKIFGQNINNVIEIFEREKSTNLCQFIPHTNHFRKFPWNTNINCPRSIRIQLKKFIFCLWLHK